MNRSRRIAARLAAGAVALVAAAAGTLASAAPAAAGGGDFGGLTYGGHQYVPGQPSGSGSTADPTRVTLTASDTTPASNARVTLTATVDTDVAPWYIQIFENETNTRIASCLGGLWCEGSISHFSGTYTYTAYARWYSGAGATSNTVAVVWTSDPLDFTLTASETVTASNTTVTLTATATTDVGPWYIQIFENETGARIASCWSGPSCAGSTSHPEGTYTYTAYVASDSSTSPPPNVQATSDPAAVLWVPDAQVLTLTASQTVTASNTTVWLTATADRNVGSSYISIFENETATQIASCSGSLSCRRPVSHASGLFTYTAYVTSSSVTSPPPNPQTTSNPAAVLWVEDPPPPPTVEPCATSGLVVCIAPGAELTRVAVPGVVLSGSTHVAGSIDLYKFTVQSVVTTVACPVLTGVNPCAAAGGTYVSTFLPLLNASAPETGTPQTIVRICNATLTVTYDGIGVNSAPALTIC